MLVVVVVLMLLMLLLLLANQLMSRLGIVISPPFL